MSAPIILVETAPRRATDGTTVAVRLAGGGGDLPYYYGDLHWRAGLSGIPNTVAALDFDGEQLGGAGVPQSMELRWSPGSSDAIEDLQGYYWTDAAVTVRIGPEGALPPIDVTGLVVDASVEGGVLAIALSDQAADLRRAVLVARFAGTGGIEGPAEWADLIKSRVWGRCFNVPGRLLDRANQVWCFGDPARAWQSFDQVRDKGVAPNAAAITVLAWQGSVGATFAALQAAATIDGGGVLCPSIACVKWWTEPAGDLHADVRGETDGGYAETAPQIAERIVATRSALPFAAGAVAATVAVRPAPCGWRIDNDSTTAIDAISDLLAGVSLSWVIVDGAIEFRRWEWIAPVRVARSERVTRRRTFKPVVARKLGYRRNASPMARGDLADIVLAQDVVYDDGTPIGDAIEDAATKAYWSNIADDNGARPKNYADVTSANVAAAVAGQSEWATTLESVGSVVGLAPNLVFNGGMRLLDTGWSVTPGSWAFTSGAGEGFYAGTAASGTVVAQSRTFDMSAGTVTLQAVLFAGGITAGTLNVDVTFLDNSNANIGTARITATSGLGWREYFLTAIAPTSTRRGYVRFFLEAATNTNAAVRRIKLAAFGERTVFSDEATNNAVYSDGKSIDGLRPGEFGANVTEARVAAAIYGQGVAATLATITDLITLEDTNTYYGSGSGETGSAGGGSGGGTVRQGFGVQP